MSLTVRTVSHPLAQKEPVPRDKIIEQSKVKAEGVLEEIKIVLGWLYNTRTLCVILTETKFIAWTKNIQDILSKDEIKANNLEMLIGRLNHTALIILLARHFFSRIRYFHSEMNAFAWYQLSTNSGENLKLYMWILLKSHQGILINLLT